MGDRKDSVLIFMATHIVSLIYFPNRVYINSIYSSFERGNARGCSWLGLNMDSAFKSTYILCSACKWPPQIQRGNKQNMNYFYVR